MAEKMALGPFLFDGERGLLTRDGKSVALGGRGAALLSALLGAHGAVVGKEALIEAAWPGTIVEENNLTVQIAALRKALGPGPDGQDWIATVPRIGYRLVRFKSPEDPPPAGSNLPTVAVLPFNNLTGRSEEDYFVDGVVEDIITGLARFSQFTVISRNSSFVYRGRAVDVRQAAVELGAQYLLEGSLRRSPDRIRINAQLVDGGSGRHLWAQNFDAASADIFEMQDRITVSVVAIAAPQIDRAEMDRSLRDRPGSLATYDLYLSALAKLNTLTREGNFEGGAMMERVIAADPSFAHAKSALAHALEYRFAMGWSASPGDRDRCIEVARSAIALAPKDARILAGCANFLLKMGHDHEHALRTVQRAVELNPNDTRVLFWAGLCNLRGGSLEEAERFFNRDIELNPLDDKSFSMACLAHVLACQGRYREALDMAERSHAAMPDFDGNYLVMVVANIKVGREQEARRLVVEYRSKSRGRSVAGIRAGYRDQSRINLLIEGMKQAGMDWEE